MGSHENNQYLSARMRTEWWEALRASSSRAPFSLFNAFGLHFRVRDAREIYLVFLETTFSSYAHIRFIIQRVELPAWQEKKIPPPLHLVPNKIWCVSFSFDTWMKPNLPPPLTHSSLSVPINHSRYTYTHFSRSLSRFINLCAETRGGGERKKCETKNEVSIRRKFVCERMCVCRSWKGKWDTLNPRGFFMQMYIFQHY
jgi:hypothetical protein